MVVPMAEGGAATPQENWQRLSPWAVGFLFLRVLVDFVRNNIPALAGAGAGVALIERIGLREVLLVSLVGVLAVALVCLIHYRRFAFRLVGDTLFVRRGIIEQKELKVRAARVQHIAIEQPLYLRLFGLVRLHVDTPGGAAAQVELPGISATLAEELRTRLLAGAREAVVGADVDHAGDTSAASGASADTGTHSGVVLFRANARGLVLHGLASNYAWVAAAALAPFLGQIERLVRRLGADTAFAERLQWFADYPLAGALAGVVLLALTLVTASVVVAWLRFHGFELSRADGRFRQRSGLLNRQEQTLSRARLQAVELVETAVGRLLGRSHIVCRQIGAVLPGEETSGRSFLVPGLARADARGLITEFWPQGQVAEDCLRVHRYFIRARIVRLSALGLLALGVAAATLGNPWYLAAAPAVPLAIWPLAWLHWRVLGYCLQGDYLQVRRGLLGRRTTLFPVHNAQRIDLAQSWFQRRRGVADVTFVLASGPVTIPCLPRSAADHLTNLALYRVEIDHARPQACR